MFLNINTSNEQKENTLLFVVVGFDVIVVEPRVCDDRNLSAILTTRFATTDKRGIL